jgi:hypothetical protein
VAARSAIQASKTSPTRRSLRSARLVEEAVGHLVVVERRPGGQPHLGEVHRRGRDHAHVVAGLLQRLDEHGRGLLRERAVPVAAVQPVQHPEQAEAGLVPARQVVGVAPRALRERGQVRRQVRGEGVGAPRVEHAHHQVRARAVGRQHRARARPVEHGLLRAQVDAQQPLLARRQPHPESGHGRRGVQQLVVAVQVGDRPHRLDAADERQ